MEKQHAATLAVGKHDCYWNIVLSYALCALHVSLTVSKHNMAVLRTGTLAG